MVFPGPKYYYIGSIIYRNALGEGLQSNSPTNELIMAAKEQMGPRIPKKLKRTFENHLERERGGYQGSLGEEVEQAIENWLAVYYLTHEEARGEVPPEDQRIIEEAIEKHSHQIARAGEKTGLQPQNITNLDWNSSHTNNDNQTGRIKEDEEISQEKALKMKQKLERMNHELDELDF